MIDGIDLLNISDLNVGQIAPISPFTSCAIMSRYKSTPLKRIDFWGIQILRVHNHKEE